MQQMQQMIPP